MTEADLYTIVKVARNEDLAEQIGRDRYFDLVDHNKVHSFHIKRWTPFNLFKEEVAKEFGIPIQFQRFWLWAKRQNNTYRPHRHVKPQQEAQPVLHPQSMRPAREGEIPVRVKNSYNPKAPGTLITKSRDMSKAVLTSIVLKQNVTMLDIVSTRMLGQFGFLAKVFSTFEDLGISVGISVEYISKSLSFRALSDIT